MAIRYRQARPGDAVAVLDLFADVYQSQQRGHVRWPVGDRRFRHMVGVSVRRNIGRYLLALQNARVVGAIHSIGQRIEALAVDRAVQRQGIGRHLMQLVMHPRNGPVVLEVQAGDSVAFNFYRALGFRPSHRFWSTGLRPYPECHVVMRRR